MPSLTYHGYACWSLEDGKTRIVLDPGGFWKSFGAPPEGSANVVCLTHLDPDHVNGLPRLTPEPPGILLAPRNLDSRWDYRADSVKVADWIITPIPLSHRFRPWVPHRGYLFSKENFRLLHLGDGNRIDRRDVELGEIDVLLLTVGGFLANPCSGARLVRALAPRRVFPMHNYFAWQAECFARLVPRAEIPVQGKRILLFDS